MLNHRRDFLRALIAAPAGATLTFRAFAQTQPQAPPPLTAQKLSDHLAVFTGDGGNIAIVLSDDGLMVIDTGLADRATDLISKIHEDVDAHKVRIVFNTHWHLDHVGANEMLGGQGAKIISHANTKKRLTE